MKLATCFLTLLAASSAQAATNDPFVYVFARSATPVLKSYRLDPEGALAHIETKSLVGTPTEGWTEERRVLSYAKREKVLVLGLTTKLATMKVAEDGTLGTPNYLNFVGLRIDCVEVVESGERTFVYAGTANPDQLYGYEMAKDGSLIALPGFPFATNTDPVDLVQVGRFLHAVEYGNSFVSTYSIAANGSLSEPQIDDSYTRPIARGWQIAASPDGSTLYINSTDVGFVQSIQRNPKDGSVIFCGLAPYYTGGDVDTLIASGKKLLAVANGDDVDGQWDVRLYKMEAGGRLRAFHDGPSGGTNMKELKFISFGRGDRFLLAVSEQETELRVLPIDKKLGECSHYATDIESLSGLSKLATLLVVER